MPEPIRVAIVDDQREIREGLRFLIDATAGYRCAGAFGSMEEALPALNTVLADVVLCDIGLPGMSGIDGIRLLKERHPGLKLVALTVYEDEDRVFHALCAGATCGSARKASGKGITAPSMSGFGMTHVPLRERAGRAGGQCRVRPAIWRN